MHARSPVGAGWCPEIHPPAKRAVLPASTYGSLDFAGVVELYIPGHQNPAPGRFPSNPDKPYEPFQRLRAGAEGAVHKTLQSPLMAAHPWIPSPL